MIKEEIARDIARKRVRSRLLAEQRADEIEAGLQHLTPAAERDRDRY